MEKLMIFTKLQFVVWLIWLKNQNIDYYECELFLQTENRRFGKEPECRQKFGRCPETQQIRRPQPNPDFRFVRQKKNHTKQL